MDAQDGFGREPGHEAAGDCGRDITEQSRPCAPAPPDAATLVNPRALKHRGLKPDPYDGPSYSELRRRAEQGEDAERAALPPGYMLHEYRVEQVLGVGGFGVTYLARDTLLDHQVAIKEYLPGDLAMRDGETGAIAPRSKRHGEDYSNGLTRFLLEARTLASFRHPNIVGVHRFFEANNTAYMVMAYERGESLNTWLSRRLLRGGGTPNELLLIEMFVPLLKGLARVHEAGFLHRDIKPANIFVRDSDESLVLLDFGAAREASATASTAGLTSIVTPGYAPFEQYHAHGRQGPWSDLYALGGVLYWFVAGRRPIEAAARVQSDPQQSAVEAGAGRYSDEFLSAIDWALATDERSRPQSVAEFLPALVGDLPISREEPGAGNRSRPRRRRARRASELARSMEAAARDKAREGQMPPRTAAVIMDAEPALVMGKEQSLLTPEGPAILAPAPAGPTTVTRAEQVTVIDGGQCAELPPFVERKGRPRRAWLALGAGLLAAAALALWAWWAGAQRAPLSLGVHPGAVVQSAAETAEWVNSLNALGAVLKRRTGHPVTPLALASFVDEAVPGQAMTAHDLYLASLDQMGGAFERLRLIPLARFRDFRVNVLVRPESGIAGVAGLKDKRLAVYPAASSHGAITLHWLGANGLRAQDVKLRVSRSPEAMVDALLFGQVDAVALPQYGADEALGRYGGKLEVLGRSEAYPGFVLAAGPQVDEAEVERLREALLSLHESEAGRAALKAVRIRQTTGTTQLEPANASDLVAASDRLERARRQFPADAPQLQVH
jgi:serine/threonine protein kinase